MSDDLVPDYFYEKPWGCRCGCGLAVVSPDLVHRLNLARHLAGVPFALASVCRCEAHNRAVGGSPASAHLAGEAADIRTRNGLLRFQVLIGLFGAGFKRVGIGDGFIHADVSGRLPSPRVWLYTKGGGGA